MKQLFFGIVVSVILILIGDQQIGIWPKQVSYITYDAEGDYLLWNHHPKYNDGIWMPTIDSFEVVSLTEEQVIILCGKLPDYEPLKLIHK